MEAAREASDEINTLMETGVGPDKILSAAERMAAAVDPLD
jgi:hypothetical protein